MKQSDNQSWLKCWVVFLSELKAFLNNLRDQWVTKQKEGEERFLDLSEGQQTVQEPRPKKRKRGKKVAQQPSDPFAKYAAELQIDFFYQGMLNLCKVELMKIVVLPS